MPEENGYWSAFGYRSSRRRMLKGVAIGGAGLAAAGLIGCASENAAAPTTSTTTQTTKQPKRGGIVTHKAASESEGNFIDPHRQPNTVAQLYRLWYQGLLGYDPRTYEVQPELAQKWEQPSQNEYIFTLQSGVKWHNKPPLNGRSLTAADIVSSLNRVRTDEPRFLSRTLFASVDKIEAIDDSRIRLTTKALDAPMLAKLSADTAMILAPEAVERAKQFTTAEEVVGTGAFVLDYVEQNVGTRSSRNPNYWKSGRPYLDEFRTAYFQNDQLAWAPFLAGQLDVVRVPGTEVKKYQERPDAYKEWFKEGGAAFIIPNVTVKPFDDPRVTKALRLFTDHQEMINAWLDVWTGRGQNGAVLVTALENWDIKPEEYGNFTEWKQPKDQAVREGLSLLQAAGFTRENPLKFELSTIVTQPYTAFGELLYAQWRKNGQGVVDLAPLKILESAAYQEVRARRTFQVLAGTNTGNLLEPDSHLSEMFRTGGSRNFGGFTDTRLDGMIDRQRTIFDVTQRKALVREINLYLIENSPTVIPANALYLNGVAPKVQDLAPEFFFNGRQYENVWIDA